MIRCTILAGIAALLMACSNNGTSEPAQQPQDAGQPLTRASEQPGGRDNPVPLGQPVEIGELVVTVTDVEYLPEQRVQGDGMFIILPHRAHVHVRMENPTNEEQRVNLFRIICQDGSIGNTQSYGESKATFTIRTLPPNTFEEGFLVVERPNGCDDGMLVSDSFRDEVYFEMPRG